MESEIYPAGWFEEMAATELAQLFDVPIQLARYVVNATRETDDPSMQHQRYVENMEFILEFLSNREN